MNSWREEYVQALHERDEREKSEYQRIDDELIHAFTELIAHTAALEAEKAANTPSEDTKSALPSKPDTQGEEKGSAVLKQKLAEALRSNSALQARVRNSEAELVKLRMKSGEDSTTIETLTKECTSLTRKIKDQSEELRGKTKLLDDVHDETISLDLQLNVSEQNVKKLRTENKELIDRWMTYKGREAEAMNKTLLN